MGKYRQASDREVGRVRGGVFIVVLTGPTSRVIVCLVIVLLYCPPSHCPRQCMKTSRFTMVHSTILSLDRDPVVT